MMHFQNHKVASLPEHRGRVARLFTCMAASEESVAVALLEMWTHQCIFQGFPQQSQLCMSCFLSVCFLAISTEFCAEQMI